jgi:hypothetical protein
LAKKSSFPSIFPVNSQISGKIASHILVDAHPRSMALRAISRV